MCNAQDLPFQEFVAGWCARCFQPECSRSQSGKSLLESRISTWHERLFENVPKLPVVDERYGKIAAQRFVSIAAGTPQTPSAWNDPRDLVEAAASEQPVVEQVRPAEPLPPAPVAVEAAPQPAVIAKESPKPPPAVPANTPNRPRQMIGGAEPKPPAPVLDPWQPKQAIQPGERLVERGSKIRFGDS